MTATDISSPSGQFWLDPHPLILASKSAGRRLALRQTGIPFIVAPARVDERGIERRVQAEGGGPDAVVSMLARAKALAVSSDNPRSLVLGADQAASCEGRLFGKPASLADAKRQLTFLAGRTHRLHSGLALARGGVPLFETVAHADLRMRRLGDEFLDAYLAAAGDAVLSCAGAYEVEGLGVHLFSDIVGDHWTIMGLPLLPLLDALRREGALLG